MKQAPSRTAHRGLTLVELLVAMVIGLLIVLAAVAALTVARQGFNAVDGASQLRDSSRFAVDSITRLVVQSGFSDLPYSNSQLKNEDGSVADPQPSLFGFDNAIPKPGALATDSATRSTSEGSDVLVLRFQAVTLNPFDTTVTATDSSMINCYGAPIATAPTARDDRAISILYMAVSKGEPSLMCVAIDPKTGVPGTAQPVVEGVENFQVLYGVDGVTPNVRWTGAADAQPTSASRYLSAAQLKVSGDDEGTRINWRRVRSVRIGMVLRSPPNSAPSSEETTLYPFGSSEMSRSGDVGTAFVAPQDGRLRQVVTFTVHLRNYQSLPVS